VTLAYEVYAFDSSLPPPTWTSKHPFHNGARCCSRRSDASSSTAGWTLLPPSVVRGGSWQLLTDCRLRGVHPGRRVLSLPLP